MLNCLQVMNTVAGISGFLCQASKVCLNCATVLRSLNYFSKKGKISLRLGIRCKPDLELPAQIPLSVARLTGKK